jgi:soluble lytic murein transglycosylase
MLGWKVRAALRAGQWKEVAARHQRHERRRPARPDLGLLEGPRAARHRPVEAHRAEAEKLYWSIAGRAASTSMLALEELGQKITVPASPAPLTPEEKAARAGTRA